MLNSSRSVSNRLCSFSSSARKMIHDDTPKTVLLRSLRAGSAPSRSVHDDPPLTSPMMPTMQRDDEKMEFERRKKRSGAKRRLDDAVRRDHPEVSANVVRGWILAGKVRVDGAKVTKCGSMVRIDDDDDGDEENWTDGASDVNACDDDDGREGRARPRRRKRKTNVLTYVGIEAPRYVCRGGDKLHACIETMGLGKLVAGRVAMDAGVSTGGFTDCLLQHGAAKVYGIDVGYGQVAEKVRTDARVTLLERTNLRHLDALPEEVSLVTLDLSFISILKVMPAVARLVRHEDAHLIALIKPQFEAGRENVGGGGIVRDDDVRMRVLDDVSQGICRAEFGGFERRAWMECPVHGAGGNREFLAWFSRNAPPDLSSSSSVK